MASHLYSDIILHSADGSAETRLSDIQLLSDSGHNLVYNAVSGGRRLVLKAAKLTDGETERNLYLLRREYDLLCRLDSPFIVSVWQIAEVPNLGLCIFMEYADGRTLDRFLDEKPDGKTRKQVLDELLQAVDYLHKKQIVHADLKPQNILVTHNGNHVKLLDLGLADDDTWRQRRIGSTPGFAAPEQLRPDGTTDCRTDIYALGHIIRLMFPRGHSLIVKRCLQASPDKRWQSVAALRSALRSHNGLWLLMILLPVVAGLIWILYPRFVSESPIVPIHDTTSNVTPDTAASSSNISIIIQPEEEQHAIREYDADDAREAMRQVCREWQHEIEKCPYKYWEFHLLWRLKYNCVTDEEYKKWITLYPGKENELTSIMQEVKDEFDNGWKRYANFPKLEDIYKRGDVTLKEREKITDDYNQCLHEMYEVGYISREQFEIFYFHTIP